MQGRVRKYCRIGYGLVVNYRPRMADEAMDDMLSALGGFLVEGPRGCGKTTTAPHHARSHIRIDAGPEVRDLASLDPRALLAGATPRLIDEWQLAPDLWNVVRHEIDDHRELGQFILSGSSKPPSDPSRHSGAGRIGRIRMRRLTYRELAEAAITGGWPGLIDVAPPQAGPFNPSYLEDLCSSAIPSATGVRHDPVRMRRLIESVARNLASEASLATLAADVSGDGAAFDPKTARTYLDALTTVFGLDDLPAWSVALRSKSRLRTSTKLHRADPALACAALGVRADRLAQDPEFFRQVFESIVTRDMRSMVEARFGAAYHYRDNTGLEIDLILEYEDRRWAAIEVKFGSSQIPQAERALLTLLTLLTLRDSRVDLQRLGQPAFLAVVTGTEYAYTLPFGVHVVPLSALAI